MEENGEEMGDPPSNGRALASCSVGRTE